MTFENLCFDYRVFFRFKVYKLTTYYHFYLQTKNKNQNYKMRNYFVKKSCCKNYSLNFDYVAYKYDSKIVRVLIKKKNYEMDLMGKEEKSLKVLKSNHFRTRLHDLCCLVFETEENILVYLI